MKKRTKLIILTIWQFFKTKKKQKVEQKRIYQTRHYDDIY